MNQISLIAVVIFIIIIGILAFILLRQKRVIDQNNTLIKSLKKHQELKPEKAKPLEQINTAYAPTLIWDDVQKLLPSTFEMESSIQENLKPVKAPFIQSSLHGLSSAAPPIIVALNSDRYLKLVGPPDALKQNLPFLKDKSGQILGDFLGEDGKIISKARFERAAPTLNAAATAACVFQALSVATAQYYLNEITDSLKIIEKKVDEILFKLESEQRGEIKGAIETIGEVYTRNLRVIERTGELDWSIPDKTEFWSRMSIQESKLRGIIHSLEIEIRKKLQAIILEISENDPLGTRIRLVETSKKKRELIDRLIDCYEKEMDIYRVALLGIVQWYQVVLAFDAQSNYSNLETRYNTMIGFVHDRNAFLAEVYSNHEFIIADAGTSWKDKVSDRFMKLSLDTTPVGKIMKSLFELDPIAAKKNKLDAISTKLNEISNSYWESLMPLHNLEDVINTPREFFLTLAKDHKEQNLILLTSQEK